MGDTLADALRSWRNESLYNQDEGWVFASPETRGRQPYWPENPLRRYVRPAARRAGITKTIGWHCFRRTFATMLKAAGEDVKTVQALMRHASSKITLDVYAQAVTEAKRSAQNKVIQSITSSAVGVGA